ncbi:putative uncharacterized protein [Bacteroides sp. CAG:709]|nr:putative uncharacterized protein [Bacteroides sp. CAG:709]
MKHSVITLMVLAVLAMVGCQKTGTKTISINVKVDETKLVAAGIPSPESYGVKISNFATGSVIETTTENGIATAVGIIPGVYTVTVSASQNQGGFTYTLAGSESNVSLIADGAEVVVKVDAVKEAALVFKEIYYTGVDPANFYFRDQFYEIYNNSTEVVYADGLCIAETVFANIDKSVIYEWPIPNADQYVFARVIWQLPGDGKTYPVQPGESFVIAQWATNHKAENLSKGLSPVDLTGAEFEAIEKETTFNGILLTDNLAINMKKVVQAGYAMPQWLTSTDGSRYVLFKPSKPLKNEDFITATNADYQGTAREIAISDVIDAVQAVNNESGMSVLGLPTALDAGAIWCSGSYVGESIARKIKETRSDGTNVYQDTNNTSNDFEVKKDPQVRRYGAKVPSWNTWINK